MVGVRTSVHRLLHEERLREQQEEARERPEVRQDLHAADVGRCPKPPFSVSVTPCFTRRDVTVLRWSSLAARTHPKEAM